MTLRVIPFTITVDMGMYSSVICRKTAYIVLDPEADEWPVPGLPRGRLKYCFIIMMPQIPMIALPQEYDHHVLVFPDVQDLDFFLPTLAMDLSSWSRFTGDRILGDIKNVQPSSSFVMDVSAALSNHTVTRWTDPGMNSYDIQQRCPDRGIIGEKLRVIFKSRASTVCWHSPGPDASSVQWVGVDRIHIQFGGERGVDTLEGRTVPEVFKISQHSRRGQWTFAGHVMEVWPLLVFFRLNHFRVQARREPAGVTITYHYLGPIS
jgi:hypothetical protein